MIPEQISNIYQDRFCKLIDNGESSDEAILKLIHRYLDGKPVKSGKRNLTAVDRDLDFWSADFWSDVSSEVFNTEAFALALARYLRQSKFTRPNWLKHLIFITQQALCQAIRYSQLFLFPTEPHWKEIKELCIMGFCRKNQNSLLPTLIRFNFTQSRFTCSTKNCTIF